MMKIKINTQQRQFPIGDLFGIFFEDINHAADGGLYAELIQNRSFEYDRYDNENYHSLTAWERFGDPDVIRISVETESPMYWKKPHYLVLESLDPEREAGICNTGYEPGIRVEKGGGYRLYFYGAREEKNVEISISLRSRAGRIYDEHRFLLTDSEWKRYECELHCKVEDDSARLVVIPLSRGKIMIDTLSLFPKDTFRQRENGLRRDLAELLADMKPKFVRFPGGCLVHDGVLDRNAKDQMYCWKNTVGVLERRPSRRNSWGYNQTFGLGFYEYFQFYEDIGAKAVPVISPGFDPHHKYAVPMEEIGTWVRDALDLIEFANGDQTTVYGKLRADMGHPKPFGLEYLAIGNEEVDEEFFERYDYYHKVIRAAYPQIKLINSAGPFPGGKSYENGWANARKNHSDLIDEHFYASPQWLVGQYHRYEGLDPEGPKAFVGEYACRSNAFSHAIAEAVFMIGLQNCADKVGLACYAPLLCNVNYINWRPDLIYFNNREAVATASYYVQKLFMNHQGVYSLPCVVEGAERQERKEQTIDGEIVLCNHKESQVVYSGIILKNEDTGEEIHFADVVLGGKEASKSLGAIQAARWSLHMKVTESEGSCGYEVEFGRQSSRDRFVWAIGGWGNESDVICQFIDGFGTSISHCQFFRRKDQYDLCLKVEGRCIETWVDYELTNQVESPGYHPDPLYVAASEDQNGDWILKAANVTQDAVIARVELAGEDTDLEGWIYSLAGYREEEENTFEEPGKIRPEERQINCWQGVFSYTFPPCSLTVMRLHAKEDVHIQKDKSR